MTIFQSIVLAFFTRALKEVNADSINADKSWLNKSLAFLGAGRSKAISTAKREQVSAELKNIKNEFNHLNSEEGSTEESDAGFHQKYLAKLGRLAISTAMIAVEKGKPPKHTEKSISHIRNTIDFFYVYCEKAGLLDAHINKTNPFDMVKYRLAQYFLEIAWAQENKGLKEFLKNPKVTIKKINAISEQIKGWRNNEKAPLNQSEFEEQKQIIQCFLDSLTVKNERICSEGQKSKSYTGSLLKVPVANVTIVGYKAGYNNAPSLGRLQKILDKLQSSINELKFSDISTEASDPLGIEVKQESSEEDLDNGIFHISPQSL